MKVFAIIPAGGSGKRIRTELPKQYHKFNGKELIAYTLETFEKCSLIDELVVAAQREYFELLEELKRRYKLDKLKRIVKGGKERQHSVFNALNSIPASDEDLIAVHDAARPLLPPSVLENAILTAKNSGSSVVAIKAKDTLVTFDNNTIEYLDREKVFYVQTPQIFSYKDLISAMDKANSENFIGTDESMLIKKFGGEINISEGSNLNFKITTESDMKIFQQIIGGEN